MIHEPSIVILDEPTTGLDPNQIVEIRELIQNIGADRTVILSTHILSEVELSCDRVLIINRGELVADGTPKELRAGFAGDQTIRFGVKSDAAPVHDALADWKASRKAFRKRLETVVALAECLADIRRSRFCAVGSPMPSTRFRPASPR